jgi:hypothetical protein
MLRWDIYRAAAKAKWIGTVEAVDADAAIKDAAKEFNIEDPKKLFAVPQRKRPFTTADRVRRLRQNHPHRSLGRAGGAAILSGLGARSAC